VIDEREKGWNWLNAIKKKTHVTRNKKCNNQPKRLEGKSPKRREELCEKRKSHRRTVDRP